MIIQIPINSFQQSFQWLFCFSSLNNLSFNIPLHNSKMPLLIQKPNWLFILLHYFYHQHQLTSIMVNKYRLRRSSRCRRHWDPSLLKAGNKNRADALFFRKSRESLDKAERSLRVCGAVRCVWGCFHFINSPSYMYMTNYISYFILHTHSTITKMTDMT